APERLSVRVRAADSKAWTLRAIEAPTMDRDEFERRLLALVRNYLDEADERYPEGYEIGDFMVIYEVNIRIPDGEQLEPWSGGLRAGWDSPVLAFSSTSSAYWLDEAWLSEALARVRRIRREVGEISDAADDEVEG